MNPPPSRPSRPFTPTRLMETYRAVAACACPTELVKLIMRLFDEVPMVPFLCDEAALLPSAVVGKIGFILEFILINFLVQFYFAFFYIGKFIQI